MTSELAGITAPTAEVRGTAREFAVLTYSTGTGRLRWSINRRDLLAQAATALYGERWQTALAHDLPEMVAVRTVQRWATGDSPVPLPVLRHLYDRLLADRSRIVLPEILRPEVTCSPEELLAFRDGTLDAEGHRRVEEKLAVDPDATRALADLAAFPDVVPAPGVEPATEAEVEESWK